MDDEQKEVCINLKPFLNQAFRNSMRPRLPVVMLTRRKEFPTFG
jgi:hypothetical protein